MLNLFIDIETFSGTDLSSAGVYKYVEDDDFTVLLFAYAVDDGPVQVVDFAAGEDIPDSIFSALFDPSVTKHAYNAQFEIICLGHHFHLRSTAALDWLKQWRCTMLHGMYCGYTAGLAATGTAMGLEDDKKKLTTGSSLIRTFCLPCRPTRTNGQRTRTLPQHEPEKWELFKKYNEQDVITEREIYYRLKRFPVPDDVQKQWQTDQLINLRGVAIDLPFVAGAVACGEKIVQELTAEASHLSGMDNPNSVAQLKAWVNAATDEVYGDMRKSTVKDLLKSGDLPNDTVRRVLEIRQELGKTSTKKYNSMLACVRSDGRIRGLLQFYGANRTGRWAGRLVQVQNLPQTHMEPESIDLARDFVRRVQPDKIQLVFGSINGTLSQLIRTAFVPSPGCVFVDADFSAIEARVIAWLADETWVLRVFSGDGKIYEAAAAQMFGVPVDKVDKAMRAKGKIATLALGYQGGVNALTAMGAADMGLSELEMSDLVNRWRQANKHIVGLWQRVEEAARGVIETGSSLLVNGRVIFDLEGDKKTDQLWMTITLPSGRKLFYAHPALTMNRWGRESISYQGMDQTTKKWTTQETYGGKLVENIVQAIARDILAEAIERVEAAGLAVVFHVHDEIIVESPTDCLEQVVSILSETPVWAGGLPLSADGWTGNYYTKE